MTDPVTIMRTLPTFVDITALVQPAVEPVTLLTSTSEPTVLVLALRVRWALVYAFGALVDILAISGGVSGVAFAAL